MHAYESFGTRYTVCFTSFTLIKVADRAGRGMRTPHVAGQTVSTRDCHACDSLVICKCSGRIGILRAERRDDKKAFQYTIESEGRLLCVQSTAKTRASVKYVKDIASRGDQSWR
eukprot:6210484-Pleurochrysis_carterae.AAC.1